MCILEFDILDPPDLDSNISIDQKLKPLSSSPLHHYLCASTTTHHQTFSVFRHFADTSTPASHCPTTPLALIEMIDIQFTPSCCNQYHLQDQHMVDGHASLYFPLVGGFAGEGSNM